MDARFLSQFSSGGLERILAWLDLAAGNLPESRQYGGIG